MLYYLVFSLLFLYIVFRLLPKNTKSRVNGVHSSSKRRPDNKPHIPSYAICRAQGRRPSMEDHHAIDVDIDFGVPGLNGVSLVTVLDGHAGKEASNYGRNNLHKNIIAAVQRQASKKEPIDLRSAIEEAFSKTDAEFLQMAHLSGISAGSTCVTAIITRESILVANIGDSRSILCLEPTNSSSFSGGLSSSIGSTVSSSLINDDSGLSGQGTPLLSSASHYTGSNLGLGLGLHSGIHVPFVEMSIDHKPNRPDERSRIEAAGGFIAHIGCWRVMGMLATSRSFGDKDLKRYVISIPEFVEVPLPVANSIGTNPSLLAVSSPTGLSSSSSSAVNPLSTASVASALSASASSLSASSLSASSSSSSLLTSVSGNAGVSVGANARPALLVLATDGLWDVFTNQEVADFIYYNREKENYGADELIGLALRRGSSDNITIAVADLRREVAQEIPPPSLRKKL